MNSSHEQFFCTALNRKKTFRQVRRWGRDQRGSISLRICGQAVKALMIEKP